MEQTLYSPQIEDRLLSGTNRVVTLVVDQGEQEVDGVGIIQWCPSLPSYRLPG